MNAIRRFALCLVTALGFATFGCTDPEPDESDIDCADCVRITSDYPRLDSDIPYDRERSEHPSGGDSWTVLVYASADNSLENAISEDLRELIQVPTTDAVRIIVQADFSEEHGTDLPIGDTPRWTTAKRFEVRDGQLVEIADLGEVNSSSADALADFMIWGTTDYPADRYAIILGSHGYGWRQFGDDESSGEHFHLSDLASAFDRAITESDSLREFALIGLDACISANTELAIQLSPFGEYLLASEHIEPAHGWDYTALELLSTNPTTDPVALATHIADRFVAYGEAREKRELTLSLTDLYEMRALQEALFAFAGGITREQNTSFVRALRDAQHFPYYRPGPAHLYDLGDLLRRWQIGDASIAPSAGTLSRVLERSVLFAKKGRHIGEVSGLTIYAPTSSRDFESSYADVPGVDSWRSFLMSLEAWQQEFTLLLEQDSLTSSESDGITTFTARIESGAEIASEYSMVLSEPGGRSDVLYIPTTINGSALVAQWDGRLLATPEGVTLYATHVGGEEYRARVYYRGSDGEMQELVMYRYGIGEVEFRRLAEIQESFGEFEPEPDGEFFWWSKLGPDESDPRSLADVGMVQPLVYGGPVDVDVWVGGGTQHDSIPRLD